MRSINQWARTYVEPALSPIALLLSRAHIKPNHVTLLAFVCGLLAVYFLLSDWALFTIFSLLHIFFDILDGILARATGATTPTGKILDWWSDRTIAFLIIAKCVWAFGTSPVTGLNTMGLLGVAALIIGLASSIWRTLSSKNLPFLHARSVIVVLGIAKLSSLIIPVALAVYIASLCWQVWYALNNL